MTFPLGTMVVNVGGCLVVGLLAGRVAVGLWPARFYMREFVFVGLLGGFTTLSTFGLDTMTLWRSGGAEWALVNIVGQMLLGVAGVYAGLKIVESITHGHI
jgi:CrcB protein